MILREDESGQLVPFDIKLPGRSLGPAWSRPLPIPKFVKVLVPAHVVIPPRFEEHRDRVAVCRGLPCAVRGCWWEVVSVHERGETHRAEAAVKRDDPVMGVALVLLDSGDKAVKLIDEQGKKNKEAR